MKNIRVTVDGSCVRRKMRIGFVIRDETSDAILEQGSRDVGFGTNNEAEYRAAIFGCRKAMSYTMCMPGVRRKIIILTDSQLMVRQLKGAYRVSPALRLVFEEAQHVFKEASARIIWHRRDNGDGPIADSLASKRKKETKHAEIQNNVVAGRD